MNKTSIESRIVQVISKELEHERQERQRLEVEAMQLENQLAEALAEIDALKQELSEISDACATTQLDAEWCATCTTRKWCKAGIKLFEDKKSRKC